MIFQQKFPVIYHSTNLQLLMIKDSHISRIQGIQILEKFFEFQCNLDKLSYFFLSRQRTRQQLSEFIKQKIRQIILRIQQQLFRAKRIKNLKIFDHASQKMFERLIQMDKFLPERHFQNLVFQQKFKSQKIQKSSTNTKFQIYNCVLKYVQQNDLLKFVIVQNEKNLKIKGPFQSAKRMYEDSQLEIIFTYYQIYQDNYYVIGQKLAALGYKEQKFQGEILQKNIKNLQLIGLYSCIEKSLKSRGGKGVLWQKFIRDQQNYYSTIQNWDPKLKAILMRIAIRDDAKPYQIKIICRKLGRTYDDKPLIDVLPKPPRKKSQKFCDTPEMEKYRQSLFTILNGKIWFNHINYET